MPQQTASRVRDFKQSFIRAMTHACNEVGGINLGQGLCDLPTPEPVREAAIQAIKDNKSIYAPAAGLPALRQQIAQKLAAHNNLNVDPDTDIVVTIGATGAFTAAVHALLNPGDGILLFEPYYGYHLEAATLAGAVPQFVPLNDDDFGIDIDAVAQAITPQTRAIVLCTPANPSGKMLTAQELDALAQLAIQHDLWVITDEIYEYIRYDGRKHISPATIAGLQDRCVTIMGLSKTFSITGWRLGYTVAPKTISQAIAKVNDIFYVCAPTPLQWGAVAGFNLPDAFYKELAEDYQRKRDLFCAALNNAGLTPHIPQGAYYVLADHQRLGCNTSEAAAMKLLDRVGIAAVPGSAFWQGDRGEHLLRFCFAKDLDVLEEACERLKRL